MARYKQQRVIAYDKRVLKSAEVATKGCLLCLDTSTGELVVGKTSTTLLPYGYSLDDVTGDGSLYCRVQLFGEVWVHLFENDSAPNAVALTDVGAECYIKDSVAVSMLSTNRSKAGRVLDVSTEGVWVQMGTAVTGPTGPSGVAPDVVEMVEQTKTLPLRGPWCLAAGTALAAFADGASTTPGLSVTDSKAVGVRWNNHATPAAFFGSIAMPVDLDDAEDITVHILASKTGATVGDAVTFDFAGYFQTIGALHDADANAGGTSDAMDGDATAKTVQHLTVTVDAADVPAQPCALSYSLKPTDGTLGTDDVIVEAVWLEYTPKLQA